jgi:hypothetical protein
MKTAAFNLVTPIQSLQKEQSHDHEQLISAAQLLHCNWYVPTFIFSGLRNQNCKTLLSVGVVTTLWYGRSDVWIPTGATHFSRLQNRSDVLYIWWILLLCGWRTLFFPFCSIAVCTECKSYAYFIMQSPRLSVTHIIYLHFSFSVSRPDVGGRYFSSISFGLYVVALNVYRTSNMWGHECESSCLLLQLQSAEYLERWPAALYEAGRSVLMFMSMQRPTVTTAELHTFHL